MEGNDKQSFQDSARQVHGYDNMHEIKPDKIIARQEGKK